MRSEDKALAILQEVGYFIIGSNLIGDLLLPHQVAKAGVCSFPEGQGWGLALVKGWDGQI